MAATQIIKPLIVTDNFNQIHSTKNIPLKLSPLSIRSSISSTGSNMDMCMEKPKRKRQRLDHLTHDEKVMRRYVLVSHDAIMLIALR